MSGRRRLTAKHLGGGTNVGRGPNTLPLEENTRARNMEYSIDGSAKTSLGFADPGWDWGENSEPIDGLGKVGLYPDLLFAAVNGKIKYVNAATRPYSSASVYNVDTGLSLTADKPVLMRDYRGMLYFCNGEDNMARIAIGRLENGEAAASATWELKDAEAYRFTDGVDKVYCEGDEADYNGWTVDDLENVTNGLEHDAGDYVTQYNTLTAPPSGSLKASCMAFFRDTLFIGGIKDEPGLLRYGKTISTAAHLVAGNIHDFSDGNNYIIGEGGPINALWANQERIYIFLKDRVHYIGVEVNTSGVELFSVDKLFTSNYGAPNPFCVCEMEGAVMFFTGRRWVVMVYTQSGVLVPDDEFDREILPLLDEADDDQTNARLTYNPVEKVARLKYIVDGVARVIKYHKQVDKFSWPSDEDASHYLFHGKTTYFGDVLNDITYKIGESIDSAGENTVHELESGDWGAVDNTSKLFLKGMVKGKKNRGSVLYLRTKVDGADFGGVREITDTDIVQDSASTPHGEEVTGSVETGSAGSGTTVFPFVYRFLLGKRGMNYRFNLSSDESGAAWSAGGAEVEYEEFESDPRTHY